MVTPASLRHLGIATSEVIVLPQYYRARRVDILTLFFVFPSPCTTEPVPFNPEERDKCTDGACGNPSRGPHSTWAVPGSEDVHGHPGRKHMSFP